MQDLTQDPSILHVTEDIRTKAAQGHYLISDIILRQEDRNYQFIDLVMEGGGTLGIALVGYIHALEQAGIRFLGMGGSSVGAIVALLAYSCGSRTEAKAEKIASLIGNMDLGNMLDGKFFPRRLSKLLGKKDTPLRIPRIILDALLSLPQILGRLGLNPGHKLYEWVSLQLSENGISTLADLNALTDTLPEGLIHRETGQPITQYDTSLRLVAADITTSTKVVFPYMAPLYWQEPEKVNPACFVRASASIPFFFQPFTVDGISDLIGDSGAWESLASFAGNPPNKVSFADGGLLSNLPIDLFKRVGIPRAPTLGARLGSKHRVTKDTEKIGPYAHSLFNTMRHCADYDFVFRNPLYNSLITYIPTDEYFWINFYMNPEEKLGLFREGVLAGHAFLEGFDWLRYKALRAAELEAMGEAG